MVVLSQPGTPADDDDNVEKDHHLTDDNHESHDLLLKGG